MMKTRGRRRQRGLIRSLSFEDKRENNNNNGNPYGQSGNRDFLTGPIPQSHVVMGSGQGKRHIVTYRQTSWSHTVVRPAIQTYPTDESSVSELPLVHEEDILLLPHEQRRQEKEKVSRQQKHKPDTTYKVIQLTRTETGAYVSKPSTFCNLFEASYHEGTSICGRSNIHDDDDIMVMMRETPSSSDESATGKLVVCPEQIDTAGGCDSLGMLSKFFEDSMDTWFSYPNMPGLLQVSSSSSSDSNGSVTSVGVLPKQGETKAAACTPTPATTARTAVGASSASAAATHSTSLSHTARSRGRSIQPHPMEKPRRMTFR